MTVPHQSPSADAAQQPPENRRRMIRRRWLTATIIVLLIGIPAVYLIISAGQSRDSGRDKEEKWSATGLTAGWPSKVQRRLYDVPIPHYSQHVAYYETNNWKTSRLYVQFQTTDAKLDTFLKRIGSDSSKLEEGRITISERNRKVVDWDLSGPGPWSGLTHKQKQPLPTQNITVNHSQPGKPMVIIVSSATP